MGARRSVNPAYDHLVVADRRARHLRDGELASRNGHDLAGLGSGNQTSGGHLLLVPDRQRADVDRAAHDALVAEAPPRRERTAGGRPSRACEPSGDARSRPHPCDGAGERHSARPPPPLPHPTATTPPLYLTPET